MLIRLLLMLFLVAHGLAHLPGFLVPWRLATLPELPYRTTLLAGRLEVGEAGIRAVGVVWLSLALTFAILSVGVYLRSPWVVNGVIGGAALSIVLSILAWPEARLGILANLAVLGLLFLALRWGGLNPG
jgi:hypothetical protein